MKLEGNFRKSIDGQWLQEHEADEIDHTKDSYDYLFDNSEIIGTNKKIVEIQGIDDEQEILSSTIAKGIAESEMSDEEEEALWNKNDLGKYTIGIPTQEKQVVQDQEKFMKPVSELEFQEISKDLNKEDEEMQKQLEEAVLELEGIF